MKKTISLLLALLLLAGTMMLLVGCDFLLDLDNDNDDDDDGKLPVIDNTTDLSQTTVSPEEMGYVENQTFYESQSIDLVTEIYGNYRIDRPFTVDQKDQNKRIYHNIYFYEEDFFQVIYYKDVTKLGRIFAILADQTDSQYAEVELDDAGKPLQINIIKAGIYNLVLDITTFAIDMVFVGEIETPVYEPLTSCELNIHVSLDDHTYWPMTLNTETNEYYIQKDIPINASISFYSQSHNSHYKVFVADGLADTLVYLGGIDETLHVHVGGKYNVYINANTYVVRLELLNPDTASYFCQVEFNKGNQLTADPSKPYIFEYTWQAQGTPTDPYVEIPAMYPQLGWKYKLTVVDVDGLVFSDTYVTESGTYKLTVNLKDFTLTVDRID